MIRFQKRFLPIVLSVFLSLIVLWAEPPDKGVSGKNGMVATAHPLASAAALEMLKKGGNAVDAAVAAAFTIGVVEPDGSGLGGGGGMVIFLKKQKKTVYINYYHKAPSQIRKITYNRNTDRHTVKSILVPGTVAGLTAALERFGTLPLKTVIEPAITAAERGFAVDETLARIMLDNVEMLQIDSSTASVFLDEGFPRMEGDTLRQPELAKTLKDIARYGREGFYSGRAAKTIVSSIAKEGGVLTLNDFKNYRAEVTVPLHGTYRGYDIYSANLPQSGATVIEALNILENADLQKMGHYSKFPATLHLIAETFTRVYADRWAYLGDPNFSNIPLKVILSKAYAKERFSDINPTKAVPQNYRKTKPGNPQPYNSKSASPTGIMIQATDLMYVFNAQEYDGHTTHLSVVDKDGNAVSLTQTLGTFFGSGKTYAGVLLNCGMANFSTRKGSVNEVAPNKRPRSSISPTIIVKNGEPFLIVGSPGAGRIISTVIELIVNAIDFKMNARQINDAPRFYCQKFDDYLHLEYGISPQVQTALKNYGHNIRVYDDLDLFFGGAQLILVDTVNGLFYGSADKRRGGVAIGY